MLIIHGDDVAKSHQFLSAQKAPEIVRLEGKTLEITELRQILDSTGLFPSDRLIIISNLFATKKKPILDLVASHQGDNIIIYETKALTPTQLKTFSKSKSQEFKPSALIFKLLDSLKPNSAYLTLPIYQQLLDSQEPAELIFAMLVRQVRLLIQALSPEDLKCAPWQKNRLISQAKAFGEEKLLDLHKQLFEIDKNLKTGKNPIDIETRIFSLLSNLK